ncbi:MAG TPA: tRNA-uridine aminocarboxypropyltransferase [Polyangiales bacterium]|nr:tRNA-uridine aminocarboxypropyltransferase [Polyangiales bacterium]
MSGLLPRAVCYRCDKPQAMCLCARIPSVDNRTDVLVLQHPRERLHPIGTARFARLGLNRSRVEVAWNAGVREDQAPSWVAPGAALLYPAPGSRELAELPPHERPQQLLVLDGTWRTAASLYRDKTWLHRLPHVRLSPSAPSRYRLRLQPLREYVSTIEAIVEALRVLEPELHGLEALLGAFDSMIDEQLEHVLRRAGPRRERVRRPEALRRLPQAITDGFERIVLVHAESVPLANRPLADGAQGAPERAGKAARGLVQVSARAFASGCEQQWHLLLARGELPSASLLDYMQLAPGDFAQAVELPAFLRQWDAFLSAAAPEPIVAAWNQSSLDLLAGARASVPAKLVLKSAYRGRCGRDHARLEDVLVAEGLQPAPNSLRGRAARTIAGAAAVADHLYALSRGER